MKIGYVAPYFYPVFGGVENNVLHSANELSKKHEVHVFTSNLKDGKVVGKNEDEIKKIKIHRFPTHRYRYYLALYPQLTKKLLSLNLDILHFHSFGILQQDLSLLCLKLRQKKIPCVCTPHGPVMAASFNPAWQKVLGGLYKYSSGRVVNFQYDKVIEVNPFQYEWIKTYGVNENKITFIPNGIPKKVFDLKINPKDKKKLEKKFNLRNKKVILSIGRLLKYKGFQDVIEILRNLEDTVYFIVGDGEYKNELLELAKRKGVMDKIFFVKKATEYAKYVLYDLCDAFVFPSEWEAFGIVTLEAFAREKPVISTRTEGGRFLIEEGKNGFLYDFGDKKTLLEKLQKLLGDKKLCKKLGKEGMEKAKTLTWDRIAKELEKLYEKLT